MRAIGAIAFAVTLVASQMVNAQTLVGSFAPSTNTDPGIWLESKLRTGNSDDAWSPSLRTLSEWLSALSTDFSSTKSQLVTSSAGNYDRQRQVAYFGATRISHNFSGGLSASHDFDPSPTQTPQPASLQGFLIVSLLGITLLIGARAAGQRRRFSHA